MRLLEACAGLLNNGQRLQGERELGGSNGMFSLIAHVLIVS